MRIKWELSKTQTTFHPRWLWVSKSRLEFRNPYCWKLHVLGKLWVWSKIPWECMSLLHRGQAEIDFVSALTWIVARNSLQWEVVSLTQLNSTHQPELCFTQVPAQVYSHFVKYMKFLKAVITSSKVNQAESPLALVQCSLCMCARSQFPGCLHCYLLEHFWFDDDFLKLQPSNWRLKIPTSFLSEKESHWPCAYQHI